MSPPYLTPYLILLDSSALLSGRSPEWQTFARMGACHIPQVVWEELQTLAHQAADPTLEQAAREFLRFYPQSGWHTIHTPADHPLLQPAAGAALSKKARLALAVAQTTYGCAISHPTALTILVTNEPGLLKQIAALHQPHLCGLPLAAWRQWLRTQRKPDVVLRHLHTLHAELHPTVAGQSASQPRARKSLAARSVAGSSPASRPPARSPRPAGPQPPLTRRSLYRPPLRRRIGQALTTLLMLMGLAIAGMAVWRTLHPPSFNQFWRELELPFRR